MPYINFSGDLIDKSSIIALHKEYSCFPMPRGNSVEKYYINIELSGGQTLTYTYKDRDHRDDRFEYLIELVGVNEKD